MCKTAFGWTIIIIICIASHAAGQLIVPTSHSFAASGTKAGTGCRILPRDRTSSFGVDKDLACPTGYTTRPTGTTCGSDRNGTIFTFVNCGAIQLMILADLVHLHQDRKSA